MGCFYFEEYFLDKKKQNLGIPHFFKKTFTHQPAVIPCRQANKR
jgi:hypothetical protein